MSITIGSYGNYSNNYYNTANSVKQTANESTTSESGKLTDTVTISGSTTKTAADELSYLASKFTNCTFVGAAYTVGTTYSSKTVNSVIIDPRFLAQMASNPELEKEYEGYISDVLKFNENFCKQEAASGWNVISMGTVIDKDGNFSGWCITRKDDKKSFLQQYAENEEQIKEKAAEKKDEQEELQEILESAGKKILGDKFKGVNVSEAETEEVDTVSPDSESGGKCTVTFNQEKRARQLASAKTPEQLKAFMSILNTDLSDCQNGLRNGWCDESEVAKVKAMIQKAQQKSGEASSEDSDKNEGIDSFTLNMLI